MALGRLVSAITAVKHISCINSAGHLEKFLSLGLSTFLITQQMVMHGILCLIPRLCLK